MLLEGEALTERQGALLEADTITYRSDSCILDATGEPHLFDQGQVLVGTGIRYDTCRRRGVVNDAVTNFTEGSTVWFLRGNVAQDSSSSRIYAGSSEITSCDLPTPHYQFAAREVKWISKNVLVARPVTLYVRDVPDPLAAVHLPGHAAGPALGDPGAAVRHQRPDPAQRRIQPPGHQHRVLLGTQRLHRPDRARSTGSPTAISSTASAGRIAGSTAS